jgi:hypothetical protein
MQVFNGRWNFTDNIIPVLYSLFIYSVRLIFIMGVLYHACLNLFQDILLSVMDDIMRVI